MSSIREEEEERRKRNNSTYTGIGLATAAIGVGVGAALYYYFNKRLNQPPQEAGESARTALSLLSPDVKQLIEAGQMDLDTLFEGIKAENQISSGSNFGLLNTLLSNTMSAGTYLIDNRHDNITETDMDTDDVPHPNYLSTLYHVATNQLYGIMRPEHDVSASEHGGDSSDHDGDSSDHDGDSSDHDGDSSDHDGDSSDHDADQSMASASETNEFFDDRLTSTSMLNDDINYNETDASHSSDDHVDHPVDSERDTTITIDADHASTATVADHDSDFDLTENDEDYVPDETIYYATSNDDESFHELSPDESEAELEFLDLDNEQRQVSENYAQISSETQQNFRERSWSLEECSICFDVMLECEQKPVKMLPCGHKFHVGCIDQWLDSHDICPNCRLPARACS